MSLKDDMLNDSSIKKGTLVELALVDGARFSFAKGVHVLGNNPAHDNLLCSGYITSEIHPNDESIVLVDNWAPKQDSYPGHVIPRTYDFDIIDSYRVRN